MDSFIPNERKPYKVEKYFKKNKMFIGLDVNSKPVYLSSEKWLSSHVDLVGSTGLGKGVAAGVMLTQASLILGEAIIVIDPKDDEYAPHVLGQLAKKVNMPYYCIDLKGVIGQWNPLSCKTPRQIEELLNVIFGMETKGSDGDFHRQKDRKAARKFSRMSIIQSESFTQRAKRFFEEGGEFLEEAQMFCEQLEDIASCGVVNVINTASI